MRVLPVPSKAVSPGVTVGTLKTLVFPAFLPRLLGSGSFQCLAIILPVSLRSSGEDDSEGRQALQGVARPEG